MIQRQGGFGNLDDAPAVALAGSRRSGRTAATGSPVRITLKVRELHENLGDYHLGPASLRPSISLEKAVAGL
jgi:hypothetical protein